MPLKYNNVIRIKNAYLNFYCSRAKFLIYHGIGSVDYWKIWFSVIFHSSIERLIWKHWYELKIDFNSFLWQYLYISLTIYVWSGNNYFMGCINCLYIRENLFFAMQLLITSAWKEDTCPLNQVTWRLRLF